MPTFDINLADEPAWPDLQDLSGELLHLGGETVWRLTALDDGMSSGAPSVALRFDLDPHAADGATVIVAETSLAAWIAATCALRGRFPDAFAGTPLEAP